MDDIFVVWSYGEEELYRFLDQLCGVHRNIQLTMERKANSKLVFLDVLVLKKTSGELGHQVFRMPTHAYHYLHQGHHSRQKRLIKTLVDRAHGICKLRNLHEELAYLEVMLQANSFFAAEMWRVMRPRRSAQADVSKEQSLAKLLHTETEGPTTTEIGEIPRDPLALCYVYRVLLQESVHRHYEV